MDANKANESRARIDETVLVFVLGLLLAAVSLSSIASLTYIYQLKLRQPIYIEFKVTPAESSNDESDKTEGFVL